MTPWSQAQNWEPDVALECSKKPRGEGFCPACILSLAFDGGTQVQESGSKTETIFGCADVTHQETERKTTKSIYLTAMIRELDQLCSQARELLRKMSLGWPREKN